MSSDRIPYKFTIREPSGNIIEIVRMENHTGGIRHQVIEFRPLTEKEIDDENKAVKERIKKFMRERGFNGYQ